MELSVLFDWHQWPLLDIELTALASQWPWIRHAPQLTSMHVHAAIDVDVRPQSRSGLIHTTDDRILSDTTIT